jgi:hypothetical protein
MTWRSLVAFREVRVNEVREVLRSWLAGDGLRIAAERAGVDRKTARRYVEAGRAAGLVRDGGVEQLCDALIGAVIGAVRPARASGHGAAWESLLAHEQQIRDWIDNDDLQMECNLCSVWAQHTTPGVDASWQRSTSASTQARLSWRASSRRISWRSDGNGRSTRTSRN